MKKTHVKPGYILAEVLLNDGSRRTLKIPRESIQWMSMIASMFPSMVDGLDINYILSDISKVAAITRVDSIHKPMASTAFYTSKLSDDLLDRSPLRVISVAEDVAIFRLGQMDMLEAVCDLLRDEAKKVPRPDGFRIYELIDKIEQLEVPHADT